MVILRPIFLAARNRFRKSEAKGQLIFRDGVLLLLALGIMSCGYYGTTWILNRLESLITLAYMSPVVPLVLILLILSGMLVISTIVNAVGSFYLSDDLDLILASPISANKFFLQRLSGVIASTSIISLIFMAPVFAAYITRFNQGFAFVSLILILLVPYFLIPGAISFIIATILVIFIPLKRTKIFLGLFIVLLLVGVWFGVDVVRLLIQAKGNAQEIVHLVRFFSTAEVPWLPSTWIGEIISISLGFSPGNVWPRFLTLYGLAGACLTGAYLVFILAYLPAYSSMKNHKLGKKYDSLFWRRIARLLPRDDRQWFAIAAKDIKLLSRDMSQLFQGILLLGIFLIYIYNLRLFAGFASVGPQDRWWANFLFVSNFCMSAFIATAICTRFVFPSISFEGKTFHWVLLKAPYSLDRYVKGKFFFWYGLVSVVHSLVVGAGTFASGGKGLEVILSVMCSWVLCYGLVGLAVGMGAIYSRFDWESVSQLAVGFGNIIFMLTASALILINIFPIWMLFQYMSWAALSAHIANATIIVGFFCIFNFLLGYFFLRRGIRALHRTMN